MVPVPSAERRLHPPYVNGSNARTNAKTGVTDLNQYAYNAVSESVIAKSRGITREGLILAPPQLKIQVPHSALVPIRRPMNSKTLG